MTGTAAIILFVVIAVYAVVLFAALIGFFRKSDPNSSDLKTVSIAIVIAARNESRNIQTLFESLAAQTVMPDEIILVDDHSDDGTFDSVKQSNAATRLNVQVFKSECKGKKAALSLGISKATSEIILVTDADCKVSPEWISVHKSEYSSGQTGFTAGMVNIVGDGIFSMLSVAENIFLQIVTTGFGKLGAPFICNGANISFRRTWFLETGGFSNDRFASGDDIVLLQRAMKQGLGIRWIGNKGVVESFASPTLGVAVDQRARWLSKLFHLQNNSSLMSGILLALVQLTVPVFIFQLAAFGEAGKVLTAAVILKSCIEVLLLSLAVPFHKRPEVILFYPLAAILYPLIAFGALVKALSGKTRWKGRELRNGVYE